MQQETINIRGIEYQIHIIDDKTVLKRYNPKAKMWITLEFADNDNEEIINQIQENISKGLLKIWNLKRYNLAVISFSCYNNK